MSDTGKISKSNHSDESTGEQVRISSLHPDDVMLGRGRHIKHVGNSRFRTLVQARVVEYTTCRNKAGKNAIAREIVRTIRDRGGRFVRRAVDDTTAVAITGSGACATNDSNPQHETTTTTQGLWEIADDATVLLKVKQTFRDYSVVARKAAAASSEEPPLSTASLSHQPERRTETLAQQLAISSSARIGSGEPQPPFTNSAAALPNTSSSFSPSSQMQQWVQTILLQQLQQQQQQLAQQERLISLLSERHEMGSTTTMPSSGAVLPHTSPFSMTNPSMGMPTSQQLYPALSGLSQQQPTITAQPQRSLTQYTDAAAFPHVESALNPSLNNELDLNTLIRIQSAQASSISNPFQHHTELGVYAPAVTAPQRAAAGTTSSSSALPQNPTSSSAASTSEFGSVDASKAVTKKASKSNR